jgi:hypothetical protein
MVAWLWLSVIDHVTDKYPRYCHIPASIIALPARGRASKKDERTVMPAKTT